MNKKRKYLQHMRIEKDIRQSEIAKAMCVSSVFYSKLENGKANLSARHRHILSEILDVDLKNICDSEIKYLSEILENKIKNESGLL